MNLCDVTLREGDQMPGRSYEFDQKLTAAWAFDELGIPLVQAGFPATGEKDRQITRELATDASFQPDVSALARAVPDDVEACLEAEADVIEIFAPVSDLHLKYTLSKSRDELFTLVDEAVEQAIKGGATVHLSLTDAFRTDRDHLKTAFSRYSNLERISLADTAGVATPVSVESVLEELSETINLSQVGVHFHDDLGVATANTIKAFEMGVGKADVSVASLGERAGNAAIEEVVAIGDLQYDSPLCEQPSALIPVCQRALEAIGEDIDPQKALLGSEVTKHESGIHTAAMLDEPSVFEPYNPEQFGDERRLIFGQGTGRSGAKKLLERAETNPTEETITEYLRLLKENGPLETEAAIELAKETFET